MPEAFPLLCVDQTAFTNNPAPSYGAWGTLKDRLCLTLVMRLEQGKTCATSSAMVAWCPFTSEEKNLDSPNSRIEKLTRYMQLTRCIKGLQER